MGNDKLIGRQEAPYVGSMNCEGVLQAQSRIREAMNPFGIAVVFRTGIEHQVEIRRTRPAFGQVAADHADAAKAYDAVVMTESSGLDIAKRDGRRQVIQPHVPSSPSWGGATAHHHHRSPAEAWRRWRGEEGANQAQASISTCTLGSREKSSAKSRRCCWRGTRHVNHSAAQSAAPARSRNTAAREEAP